jgi:N6-L-threonylcarbamoyladenine synthase
MTDKTLTILGIETSCDETAAAVVRGRAPGPGTILSNVIFSQVEAHAPYGGVVPEMSSPARWGTRNFHWPIWMASPPRPAPA